MIIKTQVARVTRVFLKDYNSDTNIQNKYNKLNFIDIL